ncbi:MAG: ABC transporter permease, partial [Nocardiopsaceae bacterium]|nr:ABC transporter permease [Nocardiopsaceae bacterium]
MSLTEVGFQAQTLETTAVAPVEGRSQWQLTWRRLRQDRVAMGSLVTIIVIIALAIAAPVFV